MATILPPRFGSMPNTAPQGTKPTNMMNAATEIGTTTWQVRPITETPPLLRCASRMTRLPSLEYPPGA
jgi:hypothetical protein